jgi:outer membrane protein assembly factor BamB
VSAWWRRLSRRRLLAAAGGIVVLLGAAALAVYLYRRDRTGSIYHPHARFVPMPAPTLPKKGPDRFAWPLYGYTKNHTRDFPAPPSVRPPYRTAWAHDTHSLLEFPPVVYGERIYQLADGGTLYAYDKHSGRMLWTRQIGTLSASTPAVDAKTVYATVMESGVPGISGRVWALNAATGQTRWHRDLSSPSESSPLLDAGRIYFGSQSGRVYALDARNGAVVWTYQAAGSVKASPTLAYGNLYFGDYSGRVQALSERTGARVWLSGSEGALFGSGTFYSTCAVVYGRVFLGNTDGRMYAYDAFSGGLDWAVQTGNYVYSSPAISSAPGLGPTVYFGSYDGTFYALDARSGARRWTYDAHGRISGSPTVIGRIVYFADLGEKITYGLGVSTGRVVYRADTGSFDPAISDGRNLFLTGTTGLYALVPL